MTPLILLVWALVGESASLMPALNRGSAAVNQLQQGNTESAPWLGHLHEFLTRVFGMHGNARCNDVCGTSSIMS